MVGLVLALSWCATIGFSATASRMTWSFARDQGLPFHKIISKVNSKFMPKSQLYLSHIVLSFLSKSDQYDQFELPKCCLLYFRSSVSVPSNKYFLIKPVSSGWAAHLYSCSCRRHCHPHSLPSRPHSYILHYRVRQHRLPHSLRSLRIILHSLCLTSLAPRHRSNPRTFQRWQLWQRTTNSYAIRSEQARQKNGK